MTISKIQIQREESLIAFDDFMGGTIEKLNALIPSKMSKKDVVYSLREVNRDITLKAGSDEIAYMVNETIVDLIERIERVENECRGL